MEGYIKLYRKITEWEWYSDTATRSVFLDILLHASHNEYKWKGIQVNRGQVIFGRKETAKRLGLSEQSVRTAIKHLKSTNEITIQSTNKYSLISVNCYEIYQSSDIKSTSKTTNKLTSNQPATNQQLTTTKNDKNDKNEKNIKRDHKITDEDKKILWDRSGELLSKGITKAHIDRFIIKCEAKGYKYIDFYKAIISWDWKDLKIPVKQEKKLSTPSWMESEKNYVDGLKQKLQIDPKSVTDAQKVYIQKFDKLLLDKKI